MPAEIYGEGYQFLQRSDLLTFEEIVRLTRIIVSAGAVKVRLTGGEPLLRQQLHKLVAMLSDIDGVEDMAMTTNAFLLPKYAQELKDAGLQRITVSLDTLDDEIFRKMNGRRSGVQKVLEGVDAAEKVGFSPIKINAVIQRGVNDHTLVDLARYCKERGWIARFIEYMDVGTLNGWRLDHVVPAKEIVAMINAELPLEPTENNYKGEVAKRYRYKDGDGEIGLITSVTQPFCGACNRLRLSAEGEIYTCLFAGKGTDLREPLRSGMSDAEIEQILRNTWGKRTDRYSEIRHELTDEQRHESKVEMYHIGG
jgi:cyclic pyranopterin phosphate synthase